MPHFSFFTFWKFHPCTSEVPNPSVVKEYCPKAGVMETKTLHTQGKKLKKSWVTLYYDCSLSTGKVALIARIKVEKVK